MASGSVWIGFLCMVPMVAQKPYPTAPDIACRVCEDVAQTWHDQFPCAGNTMALPGRFQEGGLTCNTPIFSCNRVRGELQEHCHSMVTEFQNAKNSLQIWNSLVKGGNPYMTCHDLGKCEEADQGSQISKCHGAFEEELCAGDIYCKSFTEKCSEACYTCTWIIKSWPLFQEGCRPEGVVDPVKNDFDYIPEGPLKYRHADSSGKYSDLPKPPKGASKSFLQFESQITSNSTNRRQPQTANERYPYELEEGLRAALDDIVGESGEKKAWLSHSLHLGAVAYHLRRGYGEYSQNPPEVPENSQMFPDPNSVFLEMESGRWKNKKGRRHKHRRRRKEAQQVMSKRVDSKVIAEYDKLAPAATCYAMWGRLWRSRKGRYFSSWKRDVSATYDLEDGLHGMAWDANTACKCMGKCSIQPNEDLQLIDACSYSIEDEARMRYLFSDADMSPLF
ncbi:hypothetical protein AAMO2058_000046400 [Amorphochlora amoebiformis]